MVVYVGNRSYATALVTLDPEAVVAWAHGEGHDVSDPKGLVTSDPVRAHVQSAVEQLNSQLNKWETIKQFRILPYVLDPEATPDQVTPSMKIKRKAVESFNAELVESMYTR
jgi:long-chain acyl-CoA synthetase